MLPKKKHFLFTRLMTDRKNYFDSASVQIVHLELVYSIYMRTVLGKPRWTLYTIGHVVEMNDNVV